MKFEVSLADERKMLRLRNHGKSVKDIAKIMGVRKTAVEAFFHNRKLNVFMFRKEDLERAVEFGDEYVGTGHTLSTNRCAAIQEAVQIFGGAEMPHDEFYNRLTDIVYCEHGNETISDKELSERLGKEKNVRLYMK